jgi:hypothetical protein
MKCFFIALICLGAAAPAAAQDPLSAARELYASAAYEEALATLGRLEAPDTAPSVLEQADQYRAFCLFALGRTADAQLVAANLIRRNPTLELDATDASPRITEMFADVRRRLLPDLIREHYRMARTSIDKKDYAGAEPQLVHVRRMLDEADEVEVEGEGLADLRVLVEGFLDLTRSIRANAEAAQRAAEASVRAAAAKTSVEPPRTPAVFDQSSPDVTAPVAILQQVPPIPASILPMLPNGPTRGVLDVLIDELGDVERSAIRQSINPGYDDLLLRASRQWKYRPATKGRTPIKYLKTITVVVQK